ncbi:MAG TPA: deoxyribonuclease IV [Acidobacteriaceae bacterium]|nr:deoxyribonuclease IV [Acidobacteriaceae bacterium]
MPPRIGIHLSTAGGVFRAAERAHEIGARTLQIFSSSPRMWRAAQIPSDHSARMRALRQRHDCTPLVIHTSYLVNVCSASSVVRRQSIAAFRGEIERALALSAEFLVLHPGSWRGLTRDQGLVLAAESIAEAAEGLLRADDSSCLRILIENTAGAEFSLGGSFEQVASLLEKLRPIVPVGACLDTCHCHVAGYDLVTAPGYEETVALIDRTIGLAAVRVWHMNDAKAPRGSKLDRHQHIGQGTIGLPAFRRLLNDPRFAHCAFIAETPVDEEDDDRRNLQTMLSLIARPKRTTRRSPSR